MRRLDGPIPFRGGGFPVAQAKGLWVRRPNAGLTALLWIGSTVGVLAAIVGIGMSNYHPNFFAGGS